MRNNWRVLIFAICLSACRAVPQQPLNTIQITTPSVVPMEETEGPHTGVPFTSTPEPGLTALPAEVEPAISEAQEWPEYAGQPLPVLKDEWFAGSGICASCHTGMKDDTGADVSNDRLWRPSMMANAARDPYWRASLRHEVSYAPKLRSLIEDKCTTCHMPMSASSAHLRGAQAAALDGGLMDPQNPAHPLALDGVSCIVCHQIQSGNLGEPDSFSGHYQIDPDTPMGQRAAFGPFNPPPGQANIMSSVSGFLPIQSIHIQESEVCATCHTLFTPYLDDNGEVVGEFPEQTPYLEWLNSRFPKSAACNDCHMPRAQGSVRLSITGGPRRSPVLQHQFVGGNTYIPRLILHQAEELGAAASSGEIQSAISMTVQQLQNQTASLSADNFLFNQGFLSGEVRVDVRTGHKFPTSYPSRRAWLEVQVQTAGGEILFHSGEFETDGSIPDNDHDRDPSRYEPHVLTLQTDDQVQVYEAILGDVNDHPTTTLLRAARYLKDNRLLPEGWEISGAAREISTQGEASADPDFIAGSDTLRLAINLGSVPAPLLVKINFYYQAIGFRWAQNLAQSEGPEIDSFLSGYQQISNVPVLIDSLEIQIK